METWYVIGGSNLQAQYGYGTLSQAEQYCAYLNRGKDVNWYYPAEVTDSKLLDDLNAVPMVRDDGFNLDEALSQIANEE